MTLEQELVEDELCEYSVRLSGCNVLLHQRLRNTDTLLDIGEILHKSGGRFEDNKRLMGSTKGLSQTKTVIEN